MSKLRHHMLLVASIAGIVFAAGCSSTGPASTTATRGTAVTSQVALEADATAAMSKLYSQAAGTRELVARSAGYLVCPNVLSGSLGVGVESGRCVLRARGQVDDYYRMTELSIGLQAGAQSKAVYYIFTTDEALRKFVDSKGWTAGADANVAVASVGANVGADTVSASQQVVGYVLTNAGLQGGVAMSGAKFSQLKE